MRSQPTADLPKEESGGREPQCAYVDEAAQMIWLGSGAALDHRDIEAIACRWPEWQVRSHTEGLVHQMRLSGRDPFPLMIPEQQTIDELIDELTQECDRNPGALFQALSGGPIGESGQGLFQRRHAAAFVGGAAGNAEAALPDCI